MMRLRLISEETTGLRIEAENGKVLKGVVSATLQYDADEVTPYLDVTIEAVPADLWAELRYLTVCYYECLNCRASCIDNYCPTCGCDELVRHVLHLEDHQAAEAQRLQLRTEKAAQAAEGD